MDDDCTTSKQLTPLILFSWNAEDVVRLLMEHGAADDQRDELHSTATHCLLEQQRGVFIDSIESRSESQCNGQTRQYWIVACSIERNCGACSTVDGLRC